MSGTTVVTHPRLTVTGPLALAVVGLAGCDAGPEPSAESGPDPTDATAVTTSPPADGASTTGDEGRHTGAEEATEDEASGVATVLFAGDLMLGRSIGDLILAEGSDAPWEGIAEELAAADLRVGVLETAVGTAGEAEDKIFTFQAPPEAADSVAAGGFDVVTLANNHSYDYGAEGLLETVELVSAAGVEHVGAGVDDEAAHAPVVVEAEGVELAFLGYVSVPDDWTGYQNRAWAAGDQSPGVAWADPDLIAQDVARLAGEVDHVVVLLHAGDEGSTVVNEVQVAAAEAAFEAGASAVVGSHPHVLQGYRYADETLVAWSLGNTVFDGFGDYPESLRTALLSVTFTNDAIERVEWLPATIDERGLPWAVDPEGEVGASILAELEQLPSPEVWPSGS
ncbi:CapA family protein [Ornithinimicrobium sp. Y1847]|uniref:CapA family protein n=1 Tax=Ornithinimicrobium sp. Y1847 TaxID=3405419 RepID=UPI003B66ED79